MFRLYNWSDLHLDYGTITPDELIKDLSLDNEIINVLVMTGDISSPYYQVFDEIFEKVSKLFKEVIYVAGNHEYFSKEHTLPTIKNEIRRKLLKFPNVHFLDNQYFDFYGYRFIGTTLWSQIEPRKHRMFENRVSDYSNILTEEGNLNVKNTNKMNRNAVRFIEKMIKKSPFKIIVLTHHAPIPSLPEIGLFVSDPQYADSPVISSYENNLFQFFRDPIVAWIFGHTHYRCYYPINGVKLWSNQLGRLDEILEPFDINLILNFKNIKEENGTQH